MKLASVSLWCVFCSIAANAQTIRFPAPIDFQTHFEPNPGAAAGSGSRDGWESFPLSQEAGYDPSIQPETSNGESILVRDLAPTRDGFFQLGFVRRVHLLAGNHPTIRFSLRVPYLSHTAAAHLHIFRGEDDEQHSFTITSNEWQQLTTHLDVSSIPITAIAITVDFPNAIHTHPERVALTDLHLEALATKHLPIIEPDSLWDSTRELFYARRSVVPGETLTFHTTATDVHWALTTPDGSEAAHQTGTTLHYVIPADAQPGIWKAHVESSAAESTALVLVRAAKPRGLIFDTTPAITPQLLASIRERKAELEKLTTPDAGRNIALMNAEWLLPGLPSYFAEILQPSELALMDAMLFRATGDQAALAEARMLLSTMASWNTWTHPWFPAHGYHSYYPVGLTTKYIVIAEEFLGSDLPEKDRATMDRSLLLLAVLPTYEEYVHEDRLQFNDSNWIGNTVGGALLAALTSSDPNAAGYALGLFVKERDHITTAYTSDGSYGEGITYHRFDLETTELAAAAAKRLLGVDLDASLLNGERYMRYAAFSPTELLDYGDSHIDLKPSNVFAYIAALNRSAETTDFYFRYRDDGTAQILPRVLWESQIRPVTAPLAEPPSALFPERGVAIFRDNWQTDSAVLAMRAGRNFNHNHSDQGSIFYAAHGVTWIGEAGYADYYKDPYYATYNIQAIGHNALLVDHNPESQILPGNTALDKAPGFSCTALSGDISIAQADLRSVYPSLSGYTRTLIHVTDGPTVVLDDINSATPHIYTVIWHPEQRITLFQKQNNRLTLTNEDHQLKMLSFSDSTIHSDLTQSPLPLTAYDRSEHTVLRPILQIETSTATPSTTALLATIFFPGESKDDPQQPTWNLQGNTHILRSGEWTFQISQTPQHAVSVTAQTVSGRSFTCFPQHSKSDE